MKKDTYQKPEITSETLEPETLLVAGSPPSGGGIAPVNGLGNQACSAVFD